MDKSREVVLLILAVPRVPTGDVGAKPLLGSAINVPWLTNWGAGMKPLLGSVNTVQYQVRLGFGR